jgi:formate hydrogenlyase subunit 3/multisubunit Na+/H+ antiporter MnhD subunit
MTLVLAAIVVLFAGSALAVVLAPWPRLSGPATAAAGLVAAALGIAGAAPQLAGAPSFEARLAVPLAFGEPVLGLDALSAFFLVPLFALSALAAVYGPAYLAHSARRPFATASAFQGVLVGSMALVLVSRDALSFLVAWEVMTLASYALVALEHGEADVRRAGWVYLVAGHVGVALLMALFLLLGARAGGLDFAAYRAMPAPTGVLAAVLAVLAIGGFGVKAGLVPLHVWLPEAHAAAPSHVSALMSGVMVKLGLYGILRVLGFLVPAGWWGPALVCLGFAGAIVGISQALYQRDLKRVLAYSTVENVGLVVVGLGLGYWGIHTGHTRLAALGFTAGLLHLWVHVAMKGLMFLAAGSVVHGAGTRDLERLGGLLKRMPLTGGAMVFGAVALSALPPLTGFVSEWLIYMGLVEGGVAQGGAGGLALMLAVGFLALVGGLAALAFARLVGVALLGSPRAPAAAHAHESSLALTGPLVVLVALIAFLAIAPGVALGPITHVAVQLAPSLDPRALDALGGSLSTLGLCNGVVWGALALVGLFLARRVRRVASDDTWGCGYAAPTSRMQYTGAGFAEYVATRIVPRFWRPSIEREGLPLALFARPSQLHTTQVDPLTRSIYEPFFSRWAGRLQRLRWMQQGILHVYVLYIFVAVVLSFVWSVYRAWSVR